MGEKKTVVGLLLLGFLVLAFVPSVFGVSKDWVEVARFAETGQGSTTTETFECTHVDWRIRWSFDSIINEPPLMFSITVYNSSGKIVDYFLTAMGKSGILTYNTTGTFYLRIGDLYVQNYEIIVEQNINSIPEFPSMIILSLLIGGTSFFVIVQKKSFLRAI